MNTFDYESKITEILDTTTFYELLNKDPTKKLKNHIISLIDKLQIDVK